MKNEEKKNESVTGSIMDFGSMLLGGIGELYLVKSIAKAVAKDAGPISKLGIGIIEAGSFFHGMNVGHDTFEVLGGLADITKDTISKVKAAYKGAEESDTTENEEEEQAAPDPTETADEDLF